MDYHCEHIQDVLQMYDAALTFFPNDGYYDGPPRLPTNLTSTILLQYINNVNWYSDEMMQWFIQNCRDAISIWTSFKRCFQPRLFPFMTHNQLVNWTIYLVLSGVHVEIFDGDSLVTCLTRCCTAVAFTPAYVSPLITQAEMSAIVSSRVVSHRVDINHCLSRNNNNYNYNLDHQIIVSNTQEICQQSIYKEDLINLSVPSHRNRYENSLRNSTQSSQSSFHEHAFNPMASITVHAVRQDEQYSNKDDRSRDKKYSEVQTILETDDVMTTSNRYHVIETGSMVSCDTNNDYQDDSKGTLFIISTQTDEYHNSQSWITMDTKYEVQQEYLNKFTQFARYQLGSTLRSMALMILFIENIIHIMHVQWNLLHYTASSFITISGISIIILFNFVHDTRTTVSLL